VATEAAPAAESKAEEKEEEEESDGDMVSVERELILEPKLKHVVQGFGLFD